MPDGRQYGVLEEIEWKLWGRSWVFNSVPVGDGRCVVSENVSRHVERRDESNSLIGSLLWN